MPISRSFKDISITFDKNFVTDDLAVTKDFNAIKQSVKNLVTTVPGERFFNPNIGSRITDLLFEPLDFINANLVFAAAAIDVQQFRFLSSKQFGKQFPPRYSFHDWLHMRSFMDIYTNL